MHDANEFMINHHWVVEQLSFLTKQLLGNLFIIISVELSIRICVVKRANTNRCYIVYVERERRLYILLVECWRDDIYIYIYIYIYIFKSNLIKLTRIHQSAFTLNSVNLNLI
jgi:hypothetical protein